MYDPKWLSRLSLGLLAVSALLAIAEEAAWCGRAETTSRSPHSLRSLTCGAAGSSVQGVSFGVRGTLGQPQAIGVCGDSERIALLGFWKGSAMVTTDVDEMPGTPAARLHQNYPNPFNPLTVIRYSVAKASLVEVTIFNVNGQRVKCLVNEFKFPGQHVAFWDGSGERGTKSASGIYFCRLRIGRFSEVKKMVLIR